MKRLNKILAVIVLLLIAFSVVACKSSGNKFDSFGKYYSVYSDDTLNPSENITLYADFTWSNNHNETGTFKYNDGTLTFFKDGDTVFTGTFDGEDFVATIDGTVMIYRKGDVNIENNGNSGDNGNENIENNENVLVNVNFDSVGGSFIEPYGVKKGSKIKAPINPTRTNYVFVGWYKDKEYTTEWNFDKDVLNEATILYAKWIGETGKIVEIKKEGLVNVVYDEDTVEITVNNQTDALNIAEVITVGANTEWELYYDEAGKEEVEDKIAVNESGTLAYGDNVFYIILTSEESESNEEETKIYKLKIHRIYEVTVEIYDGETLLTSIHTETCQTLQGIDVNTITGYVISGYKDEKGETFVMRSTVVTEPMKLYVQKTPKKYGVTMNANGGEIEIPKLTFDYGLDYKLPIPVRLGYIFCGWSYFSENITDENGNSLSPWNYTVDIIVTASWKVEAYEVIVERNNIDAGSIAGVGECFYNTTITLTAETNDGYTFVGFFDGETKISEGVDITYTFTMPAEDVSFSAKWIECPITIEKNLDEAGEVSGVEKTVLWKETTLTALTNDGYTFIGFFENGEKISEDLSIEYSLEVTEEKRTIEAQWAVCSVTLINEMPEAGSLSGIEKTVLGKETTIVATPNDGYTFVGWFDGEEKISAEASAEYTFTMGSEERTFTAKWINTPISLKSNLSTAGTFEIVKGSKILGEETTIVAETNEGYTFVGWFDGETKVNEENSLTYTFTLTETIREFTAKWYKLNIEKNMDEAGTVSELTGVYVVGDEAEVTAQISSGYLWLGWYDGETKVSTGNDLTYSFNMPEAEKTLTAKWRKAEIINETPDAGTLSELKGKYFLGDIVTVVAATNQGYVWRGFFEDDEKISMATTFTFALTENDITAKWYKTEVVKNLDAAGTINQLTGRYMVGDEVTLVAETNQGYTFVGWFADGKRINNDSELSVTFTLPEEGVKYEAKWSKVTVVADDAKGGRVNTLDSTYFVGQELTLIAETNPGYTWVGFFEGDTKVSNGTDNTFTFYMPSEPTTYTARWYKLGIERNYEAAGMVNTLDGTFVVGDEIELVAETNPGYTFMGWFDGDTKISSTLFTPIQMPEKATTYTAKWYRLITERNIDDGGNLSILNAKYLVGQEVTLTATVNSGYTFVGFFEGDVKVSNEGETHYTFNMPENETTIVAKWLECPMEVTINLEDAGTITYPDVTVCGKDVMLTASSNEGYMWLGWYDGDILLSEDLVYVFPMTDEERVITAKWFKVNVEKNIEEAGRLIGSYDGSKIGDDVTVSVETNDGYLWMGFYQGNTKVSNGTDTSFTFTVTEDSLTYTATWIRNAIVVERNMPEAGNVTGLETIIAVDGEATIKASVNDGYTWLGFYEGRDLLTTESEYTFVVTTDERLITARWTAGLVELRKNIEEAGSVSGNEIGTAVGKPVTVKATTNPGYTFIGWFDEEDNRLQDVVTEEFTYIVKDTATVLTAKWYKFVIVKNIEKAGTVTELNEAYVALDTVTVTSTVNDGYSWLGWYDDKGNQISSEFTVSFDLPDYSCSYTAQWLVRPLTVVKNLDEAGEVTGIETANHIGKQATLQATTNIGYTFMGWYENDVKLSGDLKYTFTLAKETKTYVAKWYKLDVVKNIDEAGEVTGINSTYLVDSEATLRATTNTGYVWMGFFIDGVKVSNGKSFDYTLAMPQENVTITAKWYKLVIDKNIDEAGEVTKARETYIVGDEIELVAETNFGYTFMGWFIGDSKVSEGMSLTYTPTLPMAETAYTAKWYKLGIEKNIDEAGEVTELNDKYVSGESVSITTTVNSGYIFAGWYEGDNKISDSGKLEYEFLMPADKTTFTARYLPYPLNVETINEEAGNITVDNGDYVVGGIVTLTTTVSAGYVFEGWFIENAKVSDSGSLTYSFEMPEDPVTITARYLDYPVKTEKNIIQAGDINVNNGTCAVGCTVTLTASVYDGYVFRGWYKDDVQVNEGFVCTFIMPETTVTYVARYLEYPLTVEKNIDEAGEVTGNEGEYAIGDTVTLEASINDGYSFIGWFNGDTKVSIGTDLTYSFVMTETKMKLMAKYVEYPLTVEKNMSVAGEITVDNGPNVVGGTVTLSAEINDGYVFIGWFKGETKVSDEISLTHSFVMTENKTSYVAKYTEDPITVKKNMDEAGEITVDKGTRVVGETVMLKAMVNDGYAFAGWYLGEEKVSNGTSMTYSFVMTENLVTYTAKYVVWNVTYEKNIAEAGTLSVVDKSAAVGGNVTLKADTNAGYTFVGWYDGATKISNGTENTCIVAVEEVHKTYTAKWYKTEVVKNIEEAGDFTGLDGAYVIGDEVTLTASTNAGYTFVGWFDGENRVSAEGALTYTFNMGNVAKTFTAKWYKIAVEKNINEAGSVSELDGKYVVGSEATLTASANDGYVFVGWFKGVQKVSQEASFAYTFNMPSEVITLTAVFAKRDLTVKANNDNAGSVSITEESSVVGGNITLKAETNAGYTFVGWFDGDSTVSTNLTCNVLVKEESKTYIAKWYKLNVSKNIENAGTINALDGKHKVGDSVTLTATVNSGYVFTGWYNGDAKISTGTSLSVNYVMTENEANITAKYILWNVSVDRNIKEAGEVSIVTRGSVVGENAVLSATTNAGYTFMGWFDGSNKVSSGTSLTCSVTISESSKTYTAKWYKLNIVKNIENAGTVTGLNSKYVIGDAVSVTASVNSGYVFVGWYLGSEKVSDVGSFTYEFDMPSTETTLTAKYITNPLTVVKDVEEAGYITVDKGESIVGGEVVLTASVNNGYVFRGWYLGDTKVSADGSFTYSFDMPETTITYTARYAEWNVSVNKNINEAGEVSISAISTAVGNNVTLTAVTNKGYTFIGWFDGSTQIGSETELSYSVKVIDETKTYTAKWNKSEIAKNIPEAGEISGLDGTYKVGDTVTLTASTNAGYTFIGWFDGTKNISNETNKLVCLVTLEEPAKTYVAKWCEVETTVNDEKAGSVNALSGKYVSGQKVNLIASTNAGYTFIGWYDGTNALISTELICEITMPSEDTVFTAKWCKVETAVNDVNAGYVNALSGTYKINQNVSLTATTNAGYTFIGWYDEKDALFSAELVCAIAMPNVNTVYTAKWCKTETAVNDVNAGSVNVLNRTYKVGDAVTLTATTNMGYTFIGWYKEDSLVSEELVYAITMPNVDMVYTAKWCKTETAVNDVNAGSVTVLTETYKVGDEVTLTATTNVGYTFIGWFNEEDTNISSTENIYTCTVTLSNTDTVYTAKWSKTSVVKNIEDAGTVTTINGTYEVGDTVVLTASVNDGYVFIGWFDGENNEVGDALTYQITMSASNVTYTAKYALLPITLNKNIDEAGSVSVISAGKTVGENVTVKATTNVGYTFIGWFNETDENVSNTDNKFACTVAVSEENVTLTAKWCKVTVAKNIENAGSITSLDSTYVVGDTVCISASVNDGYVFVGWYLGDTKKSTGTSLSYTFDMPSENVTFTAKYVMNTITIEKNKEDAGNVNISGIKAVGESVTFTANTNIGYTFIGWYNGENLLSEQPNYTTTVPAENTVYTVKWSKTTLNVNDENAGSVKGLNDKYLANGTAVITAITNMGYTFIGWFDEETEVSTNLVCEITLTEKDKVYTAKWCKVETVSDNIDAGSVTTLSGTYKVGESVTVNATVKEGYAFVGWYLGDTKKSTGTSLSYTFDMPETDTVYTAKYSPISITLNKNKTEAGEVTGLSNIKAIGEEVTFTALTNVGYTFIGWFDEENNNISNVGNILTCTVEVTTDSKIYTAEWCKVETATNSAEAGIAVGLNDKYKIGDKVTLKAVTNTGYTFIGWFNEEGDLISSELNHEITMPSKDTVYTAEWCKVSIVKDIDEAGSVTSLEGKYKVGEKVTLTASVNHGYVFVGWFYGATQVSADASLSYELTMPNENKTYTAKYMLNPLTLKKNIDEAGYIVFESEIKVVRQRVTLTAVTTPGYTFIGWYYGNVNFSQGALSFETTVPTQSAELVATWCKVETVSDNIDAGSVTALNQAYVAGETVTLSASTNAGYTFIGWYNGGTRVGTELNSEIEEMPSENTVFTAKWVKVETVSDNETAGSVSALDGTYKAGETVTLTATTNVGYTFIGWYIGNSKESGEPNYQIEMPSVDTVFTAKWCKVETAVSSEDAGTVIALSETYKAGETVTLSATTNVGYTFIGWYIGDSKKSENLDYQVTMPSVDTVYTAKWYKLNIVKEPQNAGTVSGLDQTYVVGNNVTLTAVTNPGFKFVGWYKGETDISSAEDRTVCTITMEEENVTITARWAKFNIEKNIDEAGTLVGLDENIEWGEEVTVTAVTNPGYAFIGWFDGNTNISSEEDKYTITVVLSEQGTTYVAKWYKLDIVKNIEEAGEITGLDQAYEIDDTVTLTANTNTGYTFMGWFNSDGEKISNDDLVTCTVTMLEENRTYTAKWYKLNLVKNIENAGEIVELSGAYKAGDTATLSVVTNVGYTFMGWFNSDGNKVSNSDVVTATVMMGEENATYTAKWYKLNLVKNIENAGEIVELSGAYKAGDNATLSVVTNVGYTFMGWFNSDGNKVSNSDVVTATVMMGEENATYTAKWYKLQFAKNIEEAGEIVELSGAYKVGDTAILNVVTNPGYTFIGWFDGNNEIGVGLDCEAEMPETEKTYTAKWCIVETKAENADAGTVDVLNQAYVAGQLVTLKARTHTGYTFMGWYDKDNNKVSGEPNCQIYMPSEPMTYTARWYKLQFAKNIEEAGEIQNLDGTYKVGDTVTLTASTNAGYTFIGWFNENDVNISNSDVVTCNVTMTEKVKTYTAKWYKLSIDKNITEAGNVTWLNNGMYKVGDTFTVTASTNAGYTFIGWYDGNVRIGTGTVCELQMPATENLVTYTAKWCVVKTVAENVNAGSVTALNQAYVAGETVTLSASTNAGYTFIGWYNGNSKVGENLECQVSMPSENTAYTAKWVKVETVSDDETAGSVTALSGKYNAGETVTLTASTNAGYTFIGWFDDDGKRVGTELNSEIEMPSENTVFTAKWVKVETVSDDETAGSVTALSGKYNAGETVTLSATTNAGYTFIGWYIGNSKESGEPNYQVSMPSEKTVFTAKWCKVETAVSSEDAGTVIALSGTYNAGETVTLSATTNVGYTFIGWYNENNKVSANLDCQVTMPSVDTVYTAKWSKTETAKNINEAGLVTELNGTYKVGDTVPVTASTNAGYTFIGWFKGDEQVSGELTYQIEMPSENTVYTAKWYKAEITKNINEAGEVTVLSGTYKVGDKVTVTASTNAGYAFVGWYEGETEVSTDFDYEITMTSENTVYTAKWSKAEVKKNIEEAGEVTVLSGTYKVGDVVTVTATTNAGYAFVGWYKGSSKVSGNFDYEIEMLKENTVYTAKWSKVETAVNNEKAGSVNKLDGKYILGESVTLTASTNAGYAFVGWFKNDERVSTNLVYSVTMPSESTVYTAKWSKVETAVNNEKAGSVNKLDGKYKVGERVTLTASTNAGYTFVGWFIGAEKVNGELTYQIEMPSKDTIYTAKWVKVETTVNDDKAGSVIKLEGKYKANESVTIKASTNAGYTFVGWFTGAEKVSGELTYQIEMPSENTVYTAKWCKVSIVKNIETAGSVTVLEETYKESEEVTITATVNSGYLFIGWFIEDSKVSDDLSLNYVMPSENVTLTARYVANGISVEKNIEQAGSVSGFSGVTKVGESVTLTATTNAGYTFIGWFDEANTSISNIDNILNCTVTVTKDSKTYTAKWSKVTLVKNIENAGEITELNHKYVIGDKESVNATVNDGYVFVGWYNGASKVSANASLTYEFDMPSENVTFTAKYVTTPLTLEKNIGNAGSVSGISEIKVVGESVTLKASTNAGYTFIGWFKGDSKESTSLTYTITVPEENTVYTAKWSKTETAKNINEAGSVTELNGTYKVGDTVPVTASTNAGYTFIGWFNGDEQVSTQLTYTIMFNEQNIIYTAKWCKVEAVKNIESAGTITTLNDKYSVGQSIKLTATVNDGYTFAGWYIGNSKVSTGTNLTYTFTMPKESTVYTAKYVSFPVKLDKNIEEAGTVSGLSGVKTVGEQVTLKAETNAGYTFMGWYIGDSKVSTGTSLTYPTIIGEENITYTAKWYKLKVAKTIENAGTVTNLTDKYFIGDNVTVTATVNDGYTFVGWFIDGEKVSTGMSLSYSLEMPAEGMTVTAKYMVCPVELRKNIEKAGSVSGVEKANIVGQTLTITAVTNVGYTFIGWFDGDTQITDSNVQSYQFTISETQKTYTAKWCKVDVVKNLVQAGTITELNDKYVVGENITLTATVNDGYTFVGWFEGDVKVSEGTSLTYSFVMTTESTTYTARFTEFPVKFEKNIEEAGEVSSSHEINAVGEDVVLNATTNPGYTFIGWFYKTTKISNGSELSCVVEISDEVLTYTAKWSKTEAFKNIEEAGTITELNGKYVVGETVSISAQINPGYTFVGWFEGDVKVSEGTSLDYSFEMTEKGTVYTAKYLVCPVTLEKNINEAGTVSGVEGATIINVPVTIKAETNAGYTFVGWYLGETRVSADLQLTYEFVMTEEVITYTAVWIPCPIKTEVNDASLGSISDIPETTIIGQEITLTATAEEIGYIIAGFYVGDKLVGETLSGEEREDTFTFILTEESVTYIVKFVECKNHNPSTECFCTICLAEAHDINQDCECINCGISTHALNDECMCTICETNFHTVENDCSCIECGATVHMANEYCRHGDVVYFGSYPQTRVTDEDDIEGLNAKIEQLPTDSNNYGWTSYGYYVDGAIGNYMWYIDTEFKGETYRGVYFTSYRPSTTIGVSSEENSKQDDNGYYVSTVYWFLFEPIKWRVLSEENGTALILSELIIDSGEFYVSDKGTRNENGETVHLNNYEFSTIRNWLNDNFYNTAFTDIQKELIVVTNVDNSADTTGSNLGNNYACNDTTDNVFLLSHADMVNAGYGFDELYTATDEMRKKQTSDYAMAQGAYTSTNEGNEGIGYWWLRSPYYNNGVNASRVHEAGYIRSAYVYSADVGIVPAIRIKTN